jgi:hypothetical protein
VSLIVTENQKKEKLINGVATFLVVGGVSFGPLWY